MSPGRKKIAPSWEQVNLIRNFYLTYVAVAAESDLLLGSSSVSMCQENKIDMVGPKLFCYAWCHQPQLPNAKCVQTGRSTQPWFSLADHMLVMSEWLWVMPKMAPGTATIWWHCPCDSNQCDDNPIRANNKFSSDLCPFGYIFGWEKKMGHEMALHWGWGLLFCPSIAPLIIDNDTKD